MFSKFIFLSAVLFVCQSFAVNKLSEKSALMNDCDQVDPATTRMIEKKVKVKFNFKNDMPTEKTFADGAPMAADLKVQANPKNFAFVESTGQVSDVTPSVICKLNSAKPLSAMNGVRIVKKTDDSGQITDGDSIIGNVICYQANSKIPVVKKQKSELKEEKKRPKFLYTVADLTPAVLAMGLRHQICILKTAGTSPAADDLSQMEKDQSASPIRKNRKPGQTH